MESGEPMAFPSGISGVIVCVTKELTHGLILGRNRYRDNSVPRPIYFFLSSHSPCVSFYNKLVTQCRCIVHMMAKIVKTRIMSAIRTHIHRHNVTASYAKPRRIDVQNCLTRKQAFVRDTELSCDVMTDGMTSSRAASITPCCISASSL